MNSRRSGNIAVVLAGLVGIAFTSAEAHAQVAGGSYHVTASYPLGGDGSWDYIIPDSVGHRLFISRSTRIMVVDENTGKLLGEVPDIHGAHGIALDYATGHGFATSGNDSSVVMFDLTTFKPLGRTLADQDADAILFDPASKHVFTMNGDGGSSSVIDAVTGKRITNIPLGGKPEYGVTAGNGKIYINITDKNEIVEVDAAAQKVVRRWSLAPCTGPSGLAIDRVHHLLFSGCHSGVMAISDITAGKVIATVPIGSGVDANTFDPTTGNAFSSNGDGTLTVVHEDSPTTFHVVQNVATATGAKTMALDVATHRIFLGAAKYETTPAPPAAAGRRGRPPMVPGSFVVMVVGP